MWIFFWLMMVNNNLVGGAITILKTMSSSMGFGWHLIYEMENNIHVWNHQPVMGRHIQHSHLPRFSVVQPRNVFPPWNTWILCFSCANRCQGSSGATSETDLWGSWNLKPEVSSYTRWCPPVISWFINPMNTIVISTINHSYGSYKPT